MASLRHFSASFSVSIMQFDLENRSDREEIAVWVVDYGKDSGDSGIDVLFKQSLAWA